MITALLLLMPLVTLSAEETAPAETAPAASTQPVLEELFRQVETHRSLAIKAIGQIPDRVDLETQAVMEEVDRVVIQQLTERLQQHHAQAQEQLQNVHLPDDISRWNVAWQQAKAGFFATGGIEDLCKNFVNTANQHIEPLREKLLREIQSDIQGAVDHSTQAAETRIRKDFQDAIARHFPALTEVHMTSPSLPPDLTQVPPPGGVPPGTTAIAGVVALVVSQVLRRLVPRLVSKMAGRVVSKFIPIAGALLIAWDVWDAAKAKQQLETKLREGFVEEYRASFTADVLWNAPVDEAGGESHKDRIRRDVRGHLTTWSVQCQEEAKGILVAAHVLTASPTVADYIKTATETGRDSIEVAQELHLIWEIYGKLVAVASLDDLRDMLIYADRDTLSALSGELGEKLVELFHTHGPVVLKAAAVMGNDSFLEVVRSGGTADWASLRDAFQDLPPDASKQQRRGLLSLITSGIDHQGVALSSLDAIARQGELFKVIAPELADNRDRLLDLISDDSTVRVLDDGIKRDASTTRILVEAWDRVIWLRYRDVDRRTALYAIAESRRGAGGDDAIRELAEELFERDSLTPVYMDVGRDGFRVWGYWLKEGSGQHQEQLAKRAIELFKKGYPVDSLMSREGIDLIEFCEGFPFAGPLVFTFAEPLGRAAKLVVSLLIIVPILVVLALVLWIFKKPIAGILRTIRRPNSPAAPGSTA